MHEVVSLFIRSHQEFVEVVMLLESILDELFGNRTLFLK